MNASSQSSLLGRSRSVRLLDVLERALFQRAEIVDADYIRIVPEGLGKG
jgi:hypothetical protein